MSEKLKYSPKQVKEYAPVLAITALTILASIYADRISSALKPSQTTIEKRDDLFEPSPIVDLRTRQRQKNQRLCLDECKKSDGAPKVLSRESMYYSEASSHLAQNPVDFVYIQDLNPDDIDEDTGENRGDRILKILRGSAQSDISIVLDNSVILPENAAKICGLKDRKDLTIYILNSHVSEAAQEILGNCITDDKIFYEEEAIEKLAEKFEENDLAP